MTTSISYGKGWGMLAPKSSPLTWIPPAWYSLPGPAYPTSPYTLPWPEVVGRGEKEDGNHRPPVPLCAPSPALIL